MVRGRGGAREPMSSFSTRYTFRSQLVFGDDLDPMDVGRVKVAVIMYEIVPRSNCPKERRRQCQQDDSRSLWFNIKHVHLYYSVNHLAERRD